MKIPANWTFKDTSVARGFDAHVREQLPWYDLLTHAVQHIGRHYIPENGVVYDIGASTGNISLALADTIKARNASIYSIEESEQMVKQWSGHGQIIHASALDYAFDEHDLSVLFLVLMFMPLQRRKAFVEQVYSKLRKGGAMVVVDKLQGRGGYFDVIQRRLTMAWKVRSGIDPQLILDKELSLSGVQRPITESELPQAAQCFFRFGEFAGYILER